ADASSQQVLLANLRQHDVRLAERLAHETQPTPHSTRRKIAFEDIANLDDKTLATLVRSAEPEIIMLALAGASPTMVERFLRLFPPRDAAVLRHSLGHLGPTRLSDVETAREQLATLAEDLLARDQRQTPGGRSQLSMAA